MSRAPFLGWLRRAVGRGDPPGADLSGRFRLARPVAAPASASCGLRRDCAGCGNRSITLLPVAQIGGDVIGARLLRNTMSGAASAAASVIGDLLAQTATQVVFTLLGVFFLLRQPRQRRSDFRHCRRPGHHGPGARRLLAGAAPARHGLARPAGRFCRAARRLGFGGRPCRPCAPAFDGILRRRSGLTLALALHHVRLVRRRARNLAGALPARRSALLRRRLGASRASAMRSRRRVSSFPAPGGCRRAAISRSAPHSASVRPRP